MRYVNYKGQRFKRGAMRLFTWITLLIYLFELPAAALANPERHAAPNGVPIVEINAPSAAGISHNTYDRFDVQERGLIFNNSPGITNTMLAGYIMGNDRLGGSAARVILNEVVGTRPSYLNGYMEVAGRRADLIIANPNGIVGNGFGFINTRNATLTTGKPIFANGGTLEGYAVDRGKISICGAGMDASSADRADILARAVEINAGIYASGLNVVTGANRVNADELAASRINGAPEYSGLSLDVGALGGMYANRIRLVGTEKGVGVNMDGVLSSSGDLELTSEGKIAVKGTALAGGRMTVAADNLENQGTLYAKGGGQVRGGAAVNRGLLAAGGNLAIHAGTFESSGSVGAGVQEDGALGNAGNLSIIAGRRTALAGQILAGEDLNVQGAQVELEDGRLFARDDLTLDAAGIRGDGTLSAGDTLALTADEIDAGGAMQASEIHIGARGRAALDAALYAKNIRVDADEATLSRSKVYAEKNIAARANRIRLEHSVLQADGSAELWAQGEIDHEDGALYAGKITIAAGKLNNRRGEIVQTGKQNAEIEIEGALENREGVIAAKHGLAARAGAVENAGGVIEAGRLALSAESIVNGKDGRIAALQGDAIIKARGSLSNQGLIGGNENVMIGAGSIRQNGKITAGRDLTIQADAVINRENGEIASGGNLALTAKEGFLNAGGAISAGKDLTVRADSIANQKNSEIAGGGNLELAAKREFDNAGTVFAGEDMRIAARAAVSGGVLQAGSEQSGGSLAIDARKAALHGSVTAAKDLRVQAQAADLKNSEIYAGRNLTIKTEQTIETGGAAISAERAAIETEKIGNENGVIAADELNVRAKTLRNAGGKLLQYGETDMSLQIDESLDNTDGVIAANARNMTLRSKEIHNQGGKIAHIGAGKLEVSAETLDNRAGELAANGDMILTSGALDNEAGIVAGAGNGQIAAKRLDNANGTIRGRRLALEGGQIENTEGGIEADTVSIGADSLHNGENGRIASLGKEEMRLAVRDALLNEGMVGGNGDLVIQADAVVNQENGEIASGGNLALTAKEGFLNAGGAISAGKDLTVRADSIANQKNSEIAGGGNLELAAKREFDNAGTVFAGEDMRIAARAAVSGGVLQAGSEQSGGSLAIDARKAALHGSVTAAKDLRVQAQAADLKNSEIYAGRNLTIKTEQTIETGGAAVSAERAAIETEEISNENGVIAADELNVRAKTLRNAGGKLLQYGETDMSLQIDESLDNTDGVIAANARNMTLRSKEIHNQGGKIAHIGAGKLEVSAETLDNRAGELAANGDVFIHAAGFDNEGGTVAGAGDARIAADRLDNARGTIRAERLAIDGGRIDNAAGNMETSRLAIDAERLHNGIGGRIASLGDEQMRLTVSGDLTNQGMIGGNGGAAIDAGFIVNEGQITGRETRLTAEALDNRVNGRIESAASMRLDIAQALDNRGAILAGGDLSVRAKSVNSDGVLEAGAGAEGLLDHGDLTVRTGSARVSGKIFAGGNLGIEAESADLSRSEAFAGKDLSLTAAHALNTSGASLSAGTVDVSAKTLNNQGGQIEAARLALRAGEIDNTNGTLLQTGTEDFWIDRARVIQNNGGVIAANAENFALQADRIENSGGSILHAGAGSAEIDTDRLDNDGGKILTNGGLTLRADSFGNRGAAISSQGRMAINAGFIENSGGKLEAANGLQIGAKAINNGADGKITNVSGELAMDIEDRLFNQGQIAGNGVFMLKGKTIENQGSLQSADTLTMHSDTLVNSGEISANGAVLAEAAESICNDGTLQSGGDLTLRARRAASSGTLGAGVDGNGKPEKDGVLTLEGANVFASGTLLALNIAARADEIDLSESTVYAREDVSLSGNSSVRAARAKIEAGKTATMISGGAFENSGGVLQANALNVKAAAVDNHGGKILQTGAANANIEVNGRFDNTEGFVAANGENFAAAAGELVNRGGEFVHAGTGKLAIKAAGSLDNGAGAIHSNGALDLRARDLVNADGEISALGRADLALSGNLTNAGGRVAGQGAMNVAASAILNADGKLEGGQGLDLTAGEIHNGTGGVIAGLGAGSLSIRSNGVFENRGIAAASGDAKIAADQIKNFSGRVAAQGDLNLEARRVKNDAEMTASGNLTLKASDAFDNTGLTAAGKNLTARAGGVNSTGTLGAGVRADGSLSGGNLDIQSTGQAKLGGKQLAGGDFTVAADGIDLRGAFSYAGNSAKITANGSLLHSGAELSAEKSVAITVGASLDNSGGKIEGGSLALRAAALGNQSGKLYSYSAADDSMQITGALDNTNGEIFLSGDAARIAAGTLANSGGNIEHAGAGGLNVDLSGRFANDGGVLATNGDLTLRADEIDNRGGAVSAKSAAIAGKNAIDNTGGKFLSGGAFRISTDGLLDNSGGTLQAGTALTANAERVVNGAGGQILNAGTGDLTLGARRQIVNRGEIRANGSAALDAKTADNAGGKIAAAGDLSFRLTQGLSNAGGQLHADGDFNLYGDHLTLDNAGGTLEAGRDMALTLDELKNAGGKIAADGNLALAVPKLDEGGTLLAGGDLGLSLQGDYLQKAGSSFTANGSLTLKTTGNITNEGTIGAAKDLTLTAQNVTNAKSGLLTANGDLAVDAADELKNEGKIDADVVRLNAKETTNTGSVMGGALTIRSDRLENSGKDALLAATKNVDLFVKDVFDNRDHATVYSLGDIRIASGESLGRTGRAVNQSATIEAGRDIGIFADELINKRTEFETEEQVVSQETYQEDLPVTRTPVMTRSVSYEQYPIYNGERVVKAARTYTETVTETRATKDSGAGRIAAGRDLTIGADTVTNFVSEITAGNDLAITAGKVDNISVDFTRKVVRDGADQFVVTNGLYRAKLIGVDPVTGEHILAELELVKDPNIDGPLIHRVDSSPYHEEFVETIPGYASIIEGGHSVSIDAKNIHNGSVTPGGNTVGSGSTVLPGSAPTPGNRRRVARQENAGAFGFAYNGQGFVKRRFDDYSFGGGLAYGFRIAAFEAQGGTNAFVPGGSAWERAVSGGARQFTYIYDYRKAKKSGGRGDIYFYLPEQDVGSSRRPVVSSGAAVHFPGQLVNSSGSASYLPKQAAAASGPKALSASALTEPGAPDGGGRFDGAFALPTNGLYTIHKNPDSHVLVETDSRFTEYKNFISSDYLLKSLDYDPGSVLKRLGDGFYEQQLVRDQLIEQTGGALLTGYADGEEQYKALLAGGAKAAKDFHIKPGVRLTPDQINALTEDIVWLVEEEIDGEKVLVPEVYLAPGGAHTLRPDGALIRGGDVALNASERIENTGAISGASTNIAARTVANEGGSILGGDRLSIRAEEDILNRSGSIGGGRVALAAGRDIKNETLAQAMDFGGYQTTFVGRQAKIQAEGGLSIAAGRDFVSVGGKTSGADVSIEAGRDVSFGAAAYHEKEFLGSTAGGVRSEVLADGDLSVKAGNALAIEGASLAAKKNAAFFAGNDFTIAATENASEKYSLDILLRKTDRSSAVTQVSTQIQAGGDAFFGAGRDLTIEAGKMQAGGDLAFTAGRDLTMTGAANVRNEQKDNFGGKTSSSQTVYERTELDAGGDIAIRTGGDIQLEGVRFDAAGGIGLAAGGDLALTTLKNETRTQSNRSWGRGWSRSETNDEKTVSSGLHAGGDIDLFAGGADGGILIQGSDVVSDKGAITLAAAGDIAIAADGERHVSQTDSHEKKKKMFSSKTTDRHDYSEREDVIASNLSGDTIQIGAGRDLTVKGGNIVATGDIGLAAGGDVTIQSAAQTGTEDHVVQTKKSGLFSGGGFGFTIGKRTEKDHTNEKVLSNEASVVGSIAGGVSIEAGNRAALQGSQVVAAGDVDITGKTVDIDNSTDTYDFWRKYEIKQSGLSVSLGGGVIDAAIKGAHEAKRADEAKDERLKTLYAYMAYNDLLGASKDIGNIKDGGIKNGGASVNVSVGSSSASLEQSLHAELANPSDLFAGNNVRITATGGDLDLTATQIRGKDVALEAQGDIHIDAAENTQKSQSQSKSSSWSIGYTFGAGVTGSYGKGNSRDQGDDAAYTGSQIEADGDLTIRSGGDADIIGSTVKGNKVQAAIGGDLHIESLQDKSDYNESGNSFGIGLELGKVGKLSGMGSIGKENIASIYHSVTEQAGIYAGEGGFDIAVGSNTDLTGAVIASQAEAEKNKLSTDTLTHSDIENQAHYEASSTGITISTAPDKESGVIQGITPNIGVEIKDSAESTTKSTIAEGTIEIRSGPEATFKNLNRETSGALNKLGQIFDKKSIEEKQELAQLFGQEAFKAVGDIAQKKWENAKTPEEKAKWGEGGEYKTLLHGLVGAVMNELSGNSALAGASAGAINQIVQNRLGENIDPQDRLLVSAIIGASISKILKDSAQTGAEISTNGTKNNDYGHRPTYEGAIIYTENGYFKVVNGVDTAMEEMPPEGTIVWIQDPEDPENGWDYVKGNGQDVADTYYAGKVYNQFNILGKNIVISDYTDEQKKEILAEAGKAWANAELNAAIGGGSIGNLTSLGTAGAAGSAGKIFDLQLFAEAENIQLVSLYRAVGPEEFYSIMQTGEFTVTYRTMQAKQFGLSLEQTLEFAEKYSDIGAVIEVKIPSSILEKIADTTHVDRSIFKDGTVTIQADKLKEFSDMVTEINHVY